MMLMIMIRKLEGKKPKATARAEPDGRGTIWLCDLPLPDVGATKTKQNKTKFRRKQILKFYTKVKGKKN